MDKKGVLIPSSAFLFNDLRVGGFNLANVAADEVRPHPHPHPIPSPSLLPSYSI